MDNTSIRRSSGTLEDQAADLYRHYGARPWADVPEQTREHFRALVLAGTDGADRPLAC